MGLLTAVVGAGAVASLFLIPFGVPLLGYAYARLRWAHRALRRRAPLPPRYRRMNLVASAGSLALYALMGVLLWPGRLAGYVVAAVFVLAEVVMLDALRHDGKASSPG